MVENIPVIWVILLIVLVVIVINFFRRTSLSSALANDTSVTSKQRLIQSKIYSPPPGYLVDTVEVIPELELRCASWEIAESKGTILIFTGFTEFIEKYYETISDLIKLNWSVVVFDWRGQGLSSKLLMEKDKGYIEDFSQYLQDAEAIYQQRVAHLPEPHNLLGHSMGGHLAFRELQEHPDRYHRAVLSAPMQSITGLPTNVLSRFANFFRVLGFGQSYVLGGKDGDKNKTYERLTSDLARFKKWSSIFKKEPKLLMGSATWNWSKAAAASMSLSMEPEQIKKVKTPVYLASADNDVVVNAKTHQKIEEINPLVSVISYPLARHEIYTEVDEYRNKFMQDIDTFLTAKDSSQA